ncbi:hypothetical protein [Asticcacaulis sp. W401b]|uniref:hypothetical protein n=1 Tax=Asticcacaulis sp. W401b TaxID=3388666 RepID=UPI003970BEC3
MNRLLAGVAAFCLFVGGAQALEPVRPGQDDMIRQAVHAEGRLWLLTDAGVLSHITPQNRRVDEVLSEPVHGLCSIDGNVTALTAPRSGGKWTLWTRQGETWTLTDTFDREDHENLRTLDCQPGNIVVLAGRRILQLQGPTRRIVTLSGRLPWGGQTVILTKGETLWVGVSAGEWGGGLHRVDLKTGIVTTLKNADRDICGQPLDPDCDRVNALAVSPKKPDCIVAALGGVHRMSHGRLIEVCGETIRQTYAKETVPSQNPNFHGQSLPFYGLVYRDTGLLALGADGLYDFGWDDTPTFTPFSPFRNAAGVRVNDVSNDLILVRTNIDSRTSLGGGRVLMVPITSPPVR